MERSYNQERDWTTESELDRDWSTLREYIVEWVLECPVVHYEETLAAWLDPSLKVLNTYKVR